MQRGRLLHTCLKCHWWWISGFPAHLRKTWYGYNRLKLCRSSRGWVFLKWGTYPRCLRPIIATKQWQMEFALIRAKFKLTDLKLLSNQRVENELKGAEVVAAVAACAHTVTHHRSQPNSLEPLCTGAGISLIANKEKGSKWIKSHKHLKHEAVNI